MKRKVRHVLGISGGKDSAALAVYLKDKYPQLELEYYFCDTGKELEETYSVIKNLEVYLGKKIEVLKAAEGSHELPFDHFVKFKGQFLPSTFNRWCTKNLKLDPFEKWIGDDPVVSYVGIRGDEDREGYISKKGNVQSIFPFRKNIWSEDVIAKVLKNENISFLTKFYEENIHPLKKDRALEIVNLQLSPRFSQRDKLNALLSNSTPTFNKAVFQFLKNTKYPLSLNDEFPLVENDEVLIRDDIFNILTNSGVGIPKYYNKIEFKVNGQSGEYSRSRSGCFFCFYQQKIEWVWLFEQHPLLFQEAMEYEKDGYTWIQDQPLLELIKPERIMQIKEEYLKRTSNIKTNSPFLIDILDEAEGEGCAACFI